MGYESVGIVAIVEGLQGDPLRRGRGMKTSETEKGWIGFENEVFVFCTIPTLSLFTLHCTYRSFPPLSLLSSPQVQVK